MANGFSANNNFIRNNDQAYRCDVHACSTRYNILFGDALVMNPLSDFRLNGEFLDVDAEINRLRRMQIMATDSINQVKQWIELKEDEFETKFVVTKTINADLTLFNKLSSNIARLKQIVKILNLWLGSLKDEISETIDILQIYSSAKLSLISLSVPKQSELDFGLQPNVIVTAKQNVSRSKNAKREINKLKIAESRYKLALAKIESQLNSLYRGDIKHDKKRVHFDDLIEIFGNLKNDETPLMRVQKIMSEQINSKKINMNVQATAPADYVRDDEDFNRRFDTDGILAIPYETLVNVLQKDLDELLYTDNTKTAIDDVVRRVREHLVKFENSYTRNEKDRIYAMLGNLVNQTPRFALDNYQRIINETDDTARLIAIQTNLSNMLKRLVPNDIIYQEDIIRLINLAKDRAMQYIRREQPMEVVENDNDTDNENETRNA